MHVLQVRDAKSHFSEVIAAAERGEPTTITRHGRPAAVMVPIDVARRLYPEHPRSFADLLLSFPGGLDIERDRTPFRDVDL